MYCFLEDLLQVSPTQIKCKSHAEYYSNGDLRKRFKRNLISWSINKPLRDIHHLRIYRQRQHKMISPRGNFIRNSKNNLNFKPRKSGGTSRPFKIKPVGLINERNDIYYVKYKLGNVISLTWWLKS